MRAVDVVEDLLTMSTAKENDGKIEKIDENSGGEMMEPPRVL